MTARYRPRFFDVNAPPSSVASTENPFSCPSLRTAAMPTPIELWRNPAVLEKTSTRDSWLCAASGAQTGASINASGTRRCMGGPGGSRLTTSGRQNRQSAPRPPRWTEEAPLLNGGALGATLLEGPRADDIMKRRSLKNDEASEPESEEKIRQRVIQLAFGGDPRRFEEFLRVLGDATPDGVDVILRGSAVTGHK